MLSPGVQTPSPGLELLGRLSLTILRSRLARNEKAVLLALASLVDWKSGEGQFLTGWISDRIGVSHDTAQRVIPALIEKGLVSRRTTWCGPPWWKLDYRAILALEPHAPSNLESDPPAGRSNRLTPSERQVDSTSAGEPMLDRRSSPSSGAGGPSSSTQSSSQSTFSAASIRQMDSADSQIFTPQNAISSTQTAPSTQQNASTAPQIASTDPQIASHLLRDLLLESFSQSSTLFLQQASLSGSNETQPSAPHAASAGGVTSPALLDDERLFVSFLQRWSQPLASGLAPWTVQLPADLDWYRQHIQAPAVAAGFSPTALVQGWGEYLELIERGRRPHPFPNHFKQSLHNQLQMRLRHRNPSTSQEPVSSPAPARPAGPHTARNSSQRSFPSRDEWRSMAPTSPTVSYAEFMARLETDATDTWSRARFDAFVRESGLEPID